MNGKAPGHDRLARILKDQSLGCPRHDRQPSATPRRTPSRPSPPTSPTAPSTTTSSTSQSHHHTPILFNSSHSSSRRSDNTDPSDSPRDSALEPHHALHQEQAPRRSPYRISMSVIRSALAVLYCHNPQKRTGEESRRRCGKPATAPSRNATRMRAQAMAGIKQNGILGRLLRDSWLASAGHLA